MRRLIVLLFACVLGLPACSLDPYYSVGGRSAGGVGPPIVIPATRGLVSADTVTLSGSGTSDIGEVAITNGVGTVRIGGQDVPALVYERQPFGADTLYQTLAVSADRIHVLWFYCQAGGMTNAFYEGTDGTEVTNETASGTCADTLASASQPVSFPAVDMPTPPLVTGYTVTGPDLSIPSGAPGWVNMGSTWTVLVFEDVDCTSCEAQGWYELHALLWDPGAPALLYGVFYLFSPGTPVGLDYLSPILPTLGTPYENANDNAGFTATFTTP
jgi:hypothetical protein